MKTFILIAILAAPAAVLAAAATTAASVSVNEPAAPASTMDWKVVPDGDGVFGPKRRLILNLTPPKEAKEVSSFELRYGDAPLAVLKYDKPTVPHGLQAFEFRVDDTTRSAWSRAYAANGERIPVKLVMTEAGSATVTVVANDLSFVLPRSAAQTWIVAIIVTALAIAVVWLGKSSDLLRDSGPEPAQGRRPFSLSSCQMAVWTVVVVWAFLYIWQHAGNAPALTPSVLGLIGIASGTALGAAVITVSKRGQDVQNLVDQQAKLAQLATTAGVVPQQLTEVRDEVARLQRRLAPQRSENFLMDILSDTDGISFHRLQLVAWTAVLVVVFVWETAGSLAMQDFDKTLLALMGISSGTYIGFKIPE